MAAGAFAEFLGGAAAFGVIEARGGGGRLITQLSFSDPRPRGPSGMAIAIQCMKTRVMMNTRARLRLGMMNACVNIM